MNRVKLLAEPKRSRHVVVGSGVRPWLAAAALAVAAVVWSVALGAQQEPPRFGGAYASLDQRRQALIVDWVARFARTTGQSLGAARFYDELLSLSAKTTFEAVTHALMTTTLTDETGAAIGDALALVERVDAVKGEVDGARGDRQFRMYVQLAPDAVGKLARSQQFKRGADNTVYHKGYPTNYRAQGGTPSVQVSVATDGRRADIDVDYRASSFPAALFNGHLTSSNSDVRAGDNYDRHVNRWSGFQNWWRSFFGVRQDREPERADREGALTLPTAPRIGHKTIDVAVEDFLKAWLVEGDVLASMGSISERSYACLARDSDDPVAFDRGLAPVQLMMNLKTASERVGTRTSLDGLVVGTRYVRDGLRLVRQNHHAQFVLYSVREDVAAGFDCESQLTLADPGKVSREYGRYFASSFYVDGQQAYPVVLLWAQENGYWKVVSWRSGAADTTPEPEAVSTPKVVRVRADPALVRAARDFLDSWIVRRDYDAAFGYLSPKAYACYDLERGPDAPAATSPGDAGRKVRAGLEAAGQTFGKVATFDSVVSGPAPVHPSVRVMNHQFQRAFTLTSPPNALSDAAECAARAAGAPLPDSMPLEYGGGAGMIVQVKTRSGDAPVLRLLWRMENGGWRITSYGVELP